MGKVMQSHFFSAASPNTALKSLNAACLTSAEEGGREGKTGFVVLLHICCISSNTLSIFSSREAAMSVVCLASHLLCCLDGSSSFSRMLTGKSWICHKASRVLCKHPRQFVPERNGSSFCPRRYPSSNVLQCFT